MAEAEDLGKEKMVLIDLSEDIKTGVEFTRSKWDMAMARIVARKAIICGDQPWKSVRQPLQDYKSN